MVLMEDGGLSGSPFNVVVWDSGCLGHDLAQVPVEKIGIVDQSLCVNCVIVKHQRTRSSESSTQASNYKVDNPEICKPTSSIEILDGKLMLRSTVPL
jgi:hypothetical protein